VGFSKLCFNTQRHYGSRQLRSSVQGAVGRSVATTRHLQLLLPQSPYSSCIQACTVAAAHSTYGVALLCYACTQVLLVGDSAVGKSCLLMRFTADRFDEVTTSTIGMAPACGGPQDQAAALGNRKLCAAILWLPGLTMGFHWASALHASC
jgi:hypothetical protein